MRTFEEVQRELRESIGHAYRDEVEDIQEFGGNIEHLDKATHLLNELVEIHKDGWIPTKEKEPELMEEVFLSLRSLEVVAGWKSETIFHGKQCYYICDSGDYVIGDDVLAWMPKPEPYKIKEGR